MFCKGQVERAKRSSARRRYLSWRGQTWWRAEFAAAEKPFRCAAHHSCANDAVTEWQQPPNLCGWKPLIGVRPLPIRNSRS